jgi:subtilase family serine protease
VYAQPSWQKAIGGTSAANGMRAVPDVAVSAADHDGYITYENGSYYVVSGTSAASPSFAGVMALVVEKLGGTGVGNANPGLYALLNAARNPFHATGTGNNSVPGVTGFTANGAEYNLATGLASVDGALLVNGWSAAGNATGPDFVLTASAAGGTVQTGKTGTFTVSVAESGAGQNAVTLTAMEPN